MDHRDNFKGALGAFILFGAVVSAGAFAAYAAVEDYARARASMAWPAVEGVVLSHDADAGTVRYAWFADGASHTGERVRFWTGALHRSGEIYEPGKPVAVHVAPDDSALAVIEPGGSSVIFLIVLGFAALLVFIGLAGIIRLAMLVDGLVPAPRERDYDLAPAE